jgi:putative ABC transport system permease protein
MTSSFYVAWRYLAYHRARTATLVACVTLVAALPLALDLLVASAERQLTARARSTPLMLGARGSAVDLVLGAVYFSGAPGESLDMTSVETVEASGLADPIPVHVGLSAGEFPIVGTTLDYLDFRGLRVARGRMPALLGECVVGAEVARALGLEPDDTLLSSPETVFDIAGAYPLRMRVAGVLERSHSPDDRAVLVDIRTAWVILGLGHGHQDLARSTDESMVLERRDGNVVANARLVEYTEITEDNLDAFHFHGDGSLFPVSAVLVVPRDARAGTLLRGRYVDGAARDEHVVLPVAVVGELLATVFRIEALLDAVILAVSVATLLALVLVFALSLRLRQREMETIFRIGSGRATMSALVGAEIAIVVAMSALACAALLAGFHAVVDEIALTMLTGWSSG